MHRTYILSLVALLLICVSGSLPGAETRDTVRTITVSIGLTYPGSTPITNPRIQFVSLETGLVLGEFPVEMDQVFSFTYDVTEPFYLVGLADVIGETRSLYACPGGLSEPTVFPLNTPPINAGLISLSDIAPPSRDVIGNLYNEGDHLLIPVEHRFFIYAPEYSDHLYRDGDYLYHKKHQHRYQGEIYTIDIPDGMVWDKVAGLTSGDTWTRVEVTDHTGAMLIYIFRYLEYTMQLEDQAYPAKLLVKTNCHGIMVNKTIETELGTTRFWYVNDLVVRKEVVVPPADPLNPVAGDTWLYTPIPSEAFPNSLAYDQSALHGSAPRLVLNWQAPCSDGQHTWTHYRVYANDQLLGEIPFNLTNFISQEILPGKAYQVVVRAWDGAVESAASPALLISTVANHDPNLIPRPGLSLSPNPVAKGQTPVIRIPQTREIAQLQVYNLRGQEVANIPLSLYQTECSWDARTTDGSPIAPGIYLLRLSVNSRPVATAKFLLSP